MFGTSIGWASSTGDGGVTIVRQAVPVPGPGLAVVLAVTAPGTAVLAAT